MTKEEYKEQLKDPLWNELRVKVLKRDKYTCRKCGKKDCVLQAHHKYYVKDKKAWQYPIKALITVCKECHQKIHDTEKIRVYDRVIKDTVYLPLIEEKPKRYYSPIKKKVVKPKKQKKQKKVRTPERQEKLRLKRIRKREERNKRK